MSIPQQRFNLNKDLENNNGNPSMILFKWNEYNIKLHIVLDIHSLVKIEEDAYKHIQLNDAGYLQEKKNKAWNKVYFDLLERDF